MNKTIADAYEALKGDLGNCWNYTEGVEKFVFFRAYEGDYSCYPFNHSTKDYQYICTVDEFNNFKEVT